MISWLFRIFFILVLACLAIYIFNFIRNLAKGESTYQAVVTEKRGELFPYSTGMGRKDRTEYKVTFFVPEKKTNLTFTVKDEMYEQFEIGTGGTLKHRGNILVSFTTPEAMKKPELEYNRN